jgi:hypothetical protein
LEFFGFFIFQHGERIALSAVACQTFFCFFLGGR